MSIIGAGVEMEGCGYGAHRFGWVALCGPHSLAPVSLPSLSLRGRLRGCGDLLCGLLGVEVVEDLIHHAHEVVEAAGLLGGG